MLKADQQCLTGLLPVMNYLPIIGTLKKRRVAGGTVGIVPLGMPLIVGPAVLTTIIIAVDAYGYLPTITSLIINLAFAWWVFSRADLLVRFLGEGGAKGVAKVASLLLAAIAVMMIRMEIIEMI